MDGEFGMHNEFTPRHIQAFRILLQAFYEGFHMQRGMNGALRTIFDGPTSAIVETMRINVQDDIQLPLHLTGPPPPILPFTTSLPFHLIVNIMPMDLHTAAFLVLSYPRTPIGETCKM